MEDNNSKPRKKSPKPLKILVNLFGGKTNSRSTKARDNTKQQQSQTSPPVLMNNEDCRSAMILSSPPGSMNVDSASAMLTGAGGNVGAGGEVLDVYTEMEALHLSRQDNPFIQKQVSCSQDNLDELTGEQSLSPSGAGFTRCGSQSVVSATHSLASPEPLWPNSPTRSCDPLVLEEVHSHLIRSPPPVNWPEAERPFPLSPRSCGTFSPDSSDGLELDCANNNPASTSSNYYVRSQSEEHILSPCRDLLRVGMHPSPVNLPPARGATPDPDFLLMTTSLNAGMGGGHYDAPSPRTPFSSAAPRPGSSTEKGQQQRHKIRRNHTLNLSSEHFLSSNIDPGGAVSPFRNRMGYDSGTATSVSTYAMSNAGGFPSSSHHRRSLGNRPSASKKLSALVAGPPPPASAGFNVAGGEGGGFFSSASLRPGGSGGGSGRQRRRRTSESQAVNSVRQQDAKSMENLQGEPEPLRLMCSPSSTRKSISSIGGQMLPHSPRNTATLFTRWKVKDPPPLFIT